MNRPPSKAEVDAIRGRDHWLERRGYEDTTQAEKDRHDLLAYIDYQEQVIATEETHLDWLDTHKPDQGPPRGHVEAPKCQWCDRADRPCWLHGGVRKAGEEVAWWG